MVLCETGCARRGDVDNARMYFCSLDLPQLQAILKEMVTLMKMYHLGHTATRDEAFRSDLFFPPNGMVELPMLERVSGKYFYVYYVDTTT